MSQSRKRAVGYPRVSSVGQEDGSSLETQAEAMVRLAASMGYEMGPEDVLAEIGSGANLDRPQLAKIRRMALAGEFDALYVYSTDRLSRDPVELLVLLREFTGRGVAVHFVQDPSDATPEGELLNFVPGYGDFHERIKIRERTTRGKIAVARGGRMPVGASSQPFGYDYDPETKKRVVNEVEAPVAVRIFRLYAEGWSMHRIAKTLNDEGIRSKTGVYWSVTTIRLMLSNTSYIGVDYYGRKKTVGGERGKGKQIKAPREKWIEIRGYTPLIFLEPLFWKANARLGESQERYQGRTVRRYFMSGFVECGVCGASVVGAGRTGKC